MAAARRVASHTHKGHHASGKETLMSTEECVASWERRTIHAPTSCPNSRKARAMPQVESSIPANTTGSILIPQRKKP